VNKNAEMKKEIKSLKDQKRKLKSMMEECIKEKEKN